MIKKEKTAILLSGLTIGIISSLLVLLGNPKNMGFCIACFIRDSAGALKLHKVSSLSYVRPEIIGIILGSFLISLIKREFAPKAGSSPFTRFVIATLVMIGCLMFLGCPFRMILRLAGGDLNALFGLFGFFLGILTGIFFLKKGFSLKRNYKETKSEGLIFPLLSLLLLLLIIFLPSLFTFTKEGEGPGGMHAALFISLIAGIIVGILSQRTRLCLMGGIRDFILFKDSKLLLGFLGLFLGALLTNLILTFSTLDTFFSLGFKAQSISHTDGLFNALGMFIAGLGSSLLGGCPLRQLILSGEGNSDSQITVLGLLFGASIAHNFNLAASPSGPTLNGKIATLSALVILLMIAFVNTFIKKEK